MKKWILITLLIVLSGDIFAQQKRITRAEYLAQYCDLAVKEMKRTGIPASITLAQACLESDDGNSWLAVEANNHFGIKCHSWTGEKVYKDDDEKNECFRKYPSAKKSFDDHSDFLVNSKRYAALFELSSKDYKGWAKGLKEAGYATHPKYKEYLIKIIEDNKLYEYDKGIKVNRNETDTVTAKNSHEKHRRQKSGDIDNFTITVGGREIKLNNRVKFIVVKDGETPDQLAKDLDMFAWEILRYNDLTKDSLFHNKQLIYIQPKRNKAEFGKNTHTIKDGETLYSISQLYAVKLNKLIRKNNLTPDYNAKAGDVLYLRTRKPLGK